ncbi:MAG: hypothetical protein EOR91_00990 [Mesorhizobium sp.]|nr:MAG: hypothetical protein EOR91_00990 [Mesorhizobium sp.]
MSKNPSARACTRATPSRPRSGHPRRRPLPPWSFAACAASPQERHRLSSCQPYHRAALMHLQPKR